VDSLHPSNTDYILTVGRDMLSSATKLRSEEVREFLHIPEYVTGLYEPSHAQYATKKAYYTRKILECFEESLTTFMDQYFDTHLKNNTDAETFLRQVHRFMYPQFAFQLPDRARWRKFPTAIVMASRLVGDGPSVSIII
jgi:hypothetical protein